MRAKSNRSASPVPAEVNPAATSASLAAPASPGRPEPFSTLTRTPSGVTRGRVGAAEEVEDGLGLRVDEPEDGGTADRVVLHRERVQIEQVRVEAAEAAAKVDDVVGLEAGRRP